MEKIILKNKYLKILIHPATILLLIFALPVNGLARPNKTVVKLESILTVDPTESHLVYPSSLYFDEIKDEMYVTDSGNSQLVVYNNNDYPINTIGRGRNLHGIKSCMVFKGDLYVCCDNTTEYPTGVIAVLNNAFFTKKMIVLSQLNNKLPNYIAKQITTGITNRHYVLKTTGGYVNVFDKNWQLIGTVIPREKKLGILEPATVDAIATDNQGNLYLVSEERGRIFVYNSKEEFQFSFGDKGGDVGKLSRPRSIAIDNANKRIYVCDYLRHAVLIYDFDGTYLFEIGSKGNLPGYLLYPGGVAVDRLGRLYVADTFNHRVQIFSILPQT